MKNLYTILLFSLLSITLFSCTNPNNRQFGSTTLTLEHAELNGKVSNLGYINHQKRISIGVVHETLLNASTQLAKWVQYMIDKQQSLQRNKLQKKQLNQIAYYEVIDNKVNRKFIYIFDVNKNNDAVLMKFAAFDTNTKEVPEKFIEDLYQFTAY